MKDKYIVRFIAKSNLEYNLNEWYKKGYKFVTIVDIDETFYKVLLERV